MTPRRTFVPTAVAVLALLVARPSIGHAQHSMAGMTHIVIPDGAFGWKIEGTCIVKGYERQTPIDDRMTATLTVRFSGSPTG